MVYAQKLPGNAYKVTITKLSLRVGGGSSVRIPEGAEQPLVELSLTGDVPREATVDSGVPFLTFDARFESAFRVAWREVTGTEFTHARMTLTDAELQSLPTLLIELQGDPNSPRELDPNTVASLSPDYNVIVAVPAVNYMEHLQANTRPYRARIQFDGENGSFFGANMMQGHTIVYELDDNRIGFAESRQCQANEANAVSNTGGSNNAPGTTSVGTTTGAASTGGAGSTGTGGSDDDMFAQSAAATRAGQKEEEYTGGVCETSFCKSFMAIGYVLIGTALAVAYRLSRPKERLAQAFQEARDDTRVFYSQDYVSPAYRRKAWNDEGTITGTLA